MQLNRKRPLIKLGTKKHQITQAESEEVPTQIQLSLREHNRGKGNNKQHEKTKGTNTKEEQQQRERKQSDPHKKLHSPPPRRRVKLYVGRQPTTRAKNKQPTTERREGGPSTRRDNLRTQIKQNNRKSKNHQEKTRLPSTPLLAHGTLVKTVHLRMQSSSRAAQPASR